MAELTMVEAINRAMREEMDRDGDVCVLGEDVGVDGGIFRVTDGLLARFGEQRVIDTPLAESGIVGFSIGMAIAGLRPIAEMQFSGFSYMALHQLENHAARLRCRMERFHRYHGGVSALQITIQSNVPGTPPLYIPRYDFVDDVPPELGVLGPYILTTSRGVMTGRAAKKSGVGWDVLCNLW